MDNRAGYMQTMAARADWSTPQALYDFWARIYRFEIDVAATPENAKCPRSFDTDADGLVQPWAPATCWMNPPYGAGLPRWIAKADREARLGATIVALLPARTDTAWWHDYIDGKRWVRFLRGRVTFEGAKHNAPFPSVIVVFQPSDHTGRARVG